MTPEDQKALAKRLRKFATEYAKIAGRAGGIQQVVDDVNSAADTLDPPQ